MAMNTQNSSSRMLHPIDQIKYSNLDNLMLQTIYAKRVRAKTKDRRRRKTSGNWSSIILLFSQCCISCPISHNQRFGLSNCTRHSAVAIWKLTEKCKSLKTLLNDDFANSLKRVLHTHKHKHKHGHMKRRHRAFAS